MNIRENFSLKGYNTFGIDAHCRYFVETEDETELLDFVADYEWNTDEILILGGGSNFLFTEDFTGTVFYPLMKGIQIINEDTDFVYVRVGAGEIWDDFVAWTVEKGYGGVENLSLIPGHVGAAPVQNVGAYGMEAGDTIWQIEAIDLEQAAPVTIDAERCDFAYRDSIFKKQWKNRFIISRVVFRLQKQPIFRLDYGNLREELRIAGGEVNIQAIRDAIIRIRTTKLPDVKEYPNAGSFFKNPIVSSELAQRLVAQHPGLPVYDVDAEHKKLAAGWLIEQCGWKGKVLGRAGVHAKQALVLINCGGADGTEITRLANEIRKSVFMRFDVWIDPEVYVI